MSKNTYLLLFLTKVGYEKQTDHTSGKQSDTFQTTSIGNMNSNQTTGGFIVIIPYLIIFRK